MQVSRYHAAPAAASLHPAPQDLVSPLLALAADEDQALALLRRQPALVHATDRHGNGVLHLAARANASASIVRMLVKAGADPLRVNSAGDTALHAAAARGDGDPDVISELLSAGGLMLADRHDRQRRTALERARASGSPVVVDRLIADIHLLERCEAWRSDCDGRLWCQFADALDSASLPRLQRLVMDLGGANAADRRGMTVLMRAAQAGRADVVAWLLESGADVNAVCRCKRTDITQTALMLALPYPLVTRLLLAWGADPMQQYSPAPGWLSRPRTVLHVAAISAAPESMSALLGSLPYKKWPPVDLSAALLTALRDNSAHVAFAMLEYTGKHDPRTMSEALALASATGSEELVGMLLALGADANVPDTIGRTALDIAVEHGNDDMAALLAAHGATTRHTRYPGARRSCSGGCLLQ